MYSKIEIDKMLDAIGNCVAVRCLPYSLVEMDGFKHMISVLCPNIQLPFRKSLSTNMVPKLFTRTKENILHRVSQ